ncbi:hypothetical protein [Mesorhizobium opportunistum]|uniref:Uncharacterized protein n=1 Tax=Mesorhizobium opportunistum (strain LMG 24607 / HAMBI 3007 / WSM2075) TaxID=536019 RepID=F7Y9X0_MESOW|nr:hypothetical protein [Mesorhizobium opportunistum]AEH89909.1 hypothetical protein Mesop_5495 [Mesorhizobium opportunistum WSM2075]
MAPVLSRRKAKALISKFAKEALAVIPSENISNVTAALSELAGTGKHACTIHREPGTKTVCCAMPALDCEKLDRYLKTHVDASYYAKVGVNETCIHDACT